MSDSSRSIREEFEPICDRFEAAWQSGDEPKIEAFLNEVAEADRPKLFSELFQIEYWHREKTSQTLTTEQWCERFPEYTVQIQNLLGEDTAETIIGNGKIQRESTARPGSRINYFGDYELVEEIARGGMGVVYKAKQLSLNRIVAIKLIIAGEFAGHEEVQRFYNEAEAAGKLDHPGIVPIYEIGEHQGQHYFSMGFVEGSNLSDKIKDGPLTPQEAAVYLQKIATAVAYAHGQGVIHRDLKPSNVLIDQNNEPRITDFGLARQVESGKELTITGQVLGTPSYMPPEQALGKSNTAGELSDVYSLGAVLYAMLTGRPPFRSGSPLDTLIQVLEESPIPPRQISKDVPRDLEKICLNCLDKNPILRYPSAEELAADLQCFLDSEPISGSGAGFFDQIAGVVERVRLEERFAEYSNLLFGLIPIMILTEVWITIVVWNGWSGMSLAIGQSLRVFAFVGVFYFFRKGHLLPRNSQERQLWLVWGAYILTCFVYGFSRRSVAGLFETDIELELYQGFACLTSLAFLTLATQYWGYCAIIAIVYLLLSVMMGLNLMLAPLEFGLLWAAVLAVIGFKLRRITLSSDQ